MVYQTFRLYSRLPLQTCFAQQLRFLSCHFSFWFPVTVGWGAVSIPPSPATSRSHIPQGSLLELLLAGCVGAPCKAGWRNQLFLSTKCIRWKVEWPTQWCELIHWKRIVAKYSWRSLVCVSVIISWWMVWYFVQVGVRDDGHSGKMVILNIFWGLMCTYILTVGSNEGCCVMGEGY